LLQAAGRGEYFGTMSQWQDTQNFYNAQKYEDALNTLEHSQLDATYYYNLGTILARMERIGPSLAYLEKAKHLNPHDADIQANWALVQSKLVQTLGSDRLDPASSFLEQLGEFSQLPKVQTSLDLALLLFMAVWTGVYFIKRNLGNSLKNSLGFGSLLGILFIGSFLSIGKWSDFYPIAVCLEKEIVRSGPGNHFIELSQAEAGTKLRILGPQISAAPGGSASSSNELELWHQVRYSQNGVGWVKTSGLLLL